MSEFVVPPNNYEVKMKDGTTYKPSRSGTVNIENRRHIAEINQSHARKDLDMIKQKAYAWDGDSEENRCSNCYFSAFNFSQACPRCGSDLPLSTHDDS